MEPARLTITSDETLVGISLSGSSSQMLFPGVGKKWLCSTFVKIGAGMELLLPASRVLSALHFKR